MTDENIESFLNSKIQELHRGLSLITAIPASAILELARDIQTCFTQGGRLAFVGNGGSAAEAMHLAAEFTGKCVIEHDPLPAICLNESQSAITAIANDYGVEEIFSRQVRAHLRRGDILIALSTSGTSKNILKAIDRSLELGVRSVLWSGELAPHLDGVEVWRAPSTRTPRIQEFHLIWGHLISEVVEVSLQMNSK